MSGRIVSTRFLLLAALAVAVLQSSILYYVVDSRASVLRNGAEIRLETSPVDPRDFLRGDYVILNYKISEVPAAAIVGEWPSTRARHTIYVRLAPAADGFWAVGDASFEPLAAKSGTVVIRGITDALGTRETRRDISVSYGIERYYVPEGEGRAIETARNDGRISIAARVSADGTAHIRALLQDGEPLYEEPLY